MFVFSYWETDFPATYSEATCQGLVDSTVYISEMFEYSK